MNFYETGKTAALRKLGFGGGLVGSLGKAWKGMSPAAQATAKRMGAGAAVGGAGGALAGGEDNRALGMLGGGLLGAAGGHGLGRAMEGYTRRQIGEGVRSGIAATSGRGAQRAAARRLGAEARPMLEQAQGMAFPTPGRLL
jgi:hypothetical protein